MPDVKYLRVSMKFILLTIMVLFSFASYAQECKGHIVFYNLEEGDSEADADFSFYYQESFPELNENGVSTSAHTEIPIRTDTCFATDVIVPKEQLKISLGYVFIKPTQEMKVIGGVMTDIDIRSVANEYFE